MSYAERVAVQRAMRPDATGRPQPVAKIAARLTAAGFLVRPFEANEQHQVGQQYVVSANLTQVEMRRYQLYGAHGCGFNEQPKLVPVSQIVLPPDTHHIVPDEGCLQPNQTETLKLGDRFGRTVSRLAFTASGARVPPVRLAGLLIRAGYPVIPAAEPNVWPTSGFLGMFYGGPGSQLIIFGVTAYRCNDFTFTPVARTAGVMVERPRSGRRP